jgi:iron complex transport system ATP-binding protein
MSFDERNIGSSWRLDCEALHLRRGRREVLRGIDLTIRHGECISLIGSNGAGKTSLLLALLGFLAPHSGRVCVDGRPIGNLPARVRGRFATYLPQSIERLPAFRVFDLVAAGRYPHVSPLRPLSAEDIAAVRAAISRCGLADLAERPVTQLSGGERQKALLAAAIAQDAQVLFLDEPGAALDPAHQIELVALLRALHDEGRALVIVSHDLQLPAALAGRVIALREGRVVADGLAADVLVPDQLTSIYDARFVAASTPDGRRVVLPHY